ncbi:hypothetical protein [Rickettsiella massiliensis]|uniref:hypothetical protein n=1 Tax=Rickettsiella massiliensis TaxID=676517 RepID=UPI000299DACE|nr:hypothetical protein [Rickettsiella massiliensis]
MNSESSKKDPQENIKRQALEHAQGNSQWREMTEEEFQKIVANEAKEETSNRLLPQQILGIQKEKQQHLFPNLRYLPRNNFDTPQSFKERQLLHHRYSENKSSFHYYHDLEERPGFGHIDHMPGGPNYF